MPYVSGNRPQQLGSYAAAAVAAAQIIASMARKKGVVHGNTQKQLNKDLAAHPGPADADWDAYLGQNKDVLEASQGRGSAGVKFPQMWQGSGIAHPGEFHWRAFGYAENRPVPRLAPSAPIVAQPIAPQQPVPFAQPPTPMIAPPIMQTQPALPAVSTLAPPPSPPMQQGPQTSIYYPSQDQASLTRAAQAMVPQETDWKKFALWGGLGVAAFMFLRSVKKKRSA